MLIKLVRVVLVDINPQMVRAWRHAFEKNAEVDVVHGSMLDQRVDAWVSPTNSLGRMDGGLDAAIKNHLGGAIQQGLRREIAMRYSGFMPVGHSACVETGRVVPKYLISTPTMHTSSEDISDTLNVALAAAAAFQMIDMQNAEASRSISTVALPGLGACTGRVPVKTCAHLMWVVYNMFRSRDFVDFGEMRRAFERAVLN